MTGAIRMIDIASGGVNGSISPVASDVCSMFETDDRQWARSEEPVTRRRPDCPEVRDVDDRRRGASPSNALLDCFD